MVTGKGKMMARLTGRRAAGAADGLGGASSFRSQAGPLATRRQGGRQVRGRGEVSFETAAKPVASLAARRQQRARPALLSVRSKATEAEVRPYTPSTPAMGSGPVRSARLLRRAPEGRLYDDEPLAARTVSVRGSGLARLARPSPEELAPTREPRWQHDQFDGPKTIGSAVFVRNLPPGFATAAQLAGVFAAAGQVASVQVDAGPLPTATIGFVRQDAALEAERRFHGRLVQGSQMKVSVKENSSLNVNGDDEDFWRQELKDMAKRPRQAAFEGAGAVRDARREELRPLRGGGVRDARREDLQPPTKRVKGRGAVTFVRT